MAMNARPTPTQWLAALTVWALIAYGLFGASKPVPASGPFVRLAQVTPNPACPCPR